MHVLVGDHVEGDALRFEPLNQVHVGAQLPEPVVGRANVDQRPQPRRVTDPRPVVVVVIHRVAVLGVAIEVALLRSDDRKVIGKQFVPEFDPPARVAIGHVAGGGDQQRQRRSGPVARRPHDERDVVFLISGCQACGVEAAGRVGGDFQFEVGVPLAVVERVVEEVDRGVLFRRVIEVQLSSGPVGAAYGANRQIDQPAVSAVGRDVDDVVCLHRAREIPGGADVRAQTTGNRVAAQGFHFTALQDPGSNDRTLDPAVEDHLSNRLPAGLLAAGGGDQQRRVAADDCTSLAVVSGLSARGVASVGVQQLLPQANLTAGAVVCRADQVPLAGDKGLSEREFRQTALAVAQLQDEAVIRVGPESKSAAGVDIHLRDNAGPTKSRERGKNDSLQAEITESVECGSVRNDGIRAAIGLLTASGILAAHRRWQELIPVARPLGLAISRDQANDVRPVAVDAGFAADHEADALAGGDADLVAVASNLLFEHGLLPRR